MWRKFWREYFFVIDTLFSCSVEVISMHENLEFTPLVYSNYLFPNYNPFCVRLFVLIFYEKNVKF